MEISRLFSCTIDELLKMDMEPHADCYSEVSLADVPAMRLARYVVISPQPERDVQLVLEHWAKESGLAELRQPLRMIGWDFPFVSKEQQNRLGLRGTRSSRCAIRSAKRLTGFRRGINAFWRIWVQTDSRRATARRSSPALKRSTSGRG